MPDVYVTCEECGIKVPQAVELRYNGQIPVNDLSNWTVTPSLSDLHFVMVDKKTAKVFCGNDCAVKFTINNLK